jgi:SAM-dependent methyltransferase
VAGYALRSELTVAETAILERLRPRLAGAALLDLGVGGGRTTLHLAPLVGHYVGADYSAAMIDECRRRFARPEQAWMDHAEFVVCDASDMRRFDDASFDVVWFSYHGLDALDEAGRVAALLEMVRVTRPGGTVVFSSHNLSALRRKLPWRRGPRALRRAILARRGVTSLNPRLDPGTDAGSAVVRERRPSGELLDMVHVQPLSQVRALRALGLADVSAIDEHGRSVSSDDDIAALDDDSIHYWAVVTAARTSP